MNLSPAGLRRLGLLPARGGSKRIPRKNVIDFRGRPMLSYPLRAAQESGLFDLVHVSTDDEEIADVARQHGADVRFMRSPSLADDFTGILHVARWVLQQFDALGEKFDDVVILFPAAPLLEASDLLAAYEVYLQHGRTRNLLTVSQAPAFLEWYYRREQDGRLVPVHPGGAFVRSQDLKPAFYETGTFTIFSREWLLGSSELTDDTNYVSYPLPPWKAVDIDTKDDLQFAALLFDAMMKRRGASASDAVA